VIGGTVCKNVFFGLMLLIAPTLLQSVTLFREYFGTEGILSSGNDFLQTDDQGYLLVGYTWNVWDKDMSLVRTDSLGDILWTRHYGGTANEVGYSIAEADDGHVLAGFTDCYAGWGKDISLIKTTADGDSVWTAIYGRAGDQEAFCIEKTGDGGYIVAGYTIEPVSDYRRMYLLKISANGDDLWKRAYGCSGWDEAFSVIQTQDGGYAVAGWRLGASAPEMCVMKISLSGDSLWARTYAEGRYGKGCSILETDDYELVVAGWWEQTGKEDGGACLLRLKPDGDTLWTRTYSGFPDSKAYSFCRTRDNGFALVGTTSWNYGLVYLVRTDQNGDTLWTRLFGDETCSPWIAHSVSETPDGGYTLTGQHSEYAFCSFFIKTDSLSRINPIEMLPRVSDQDSYDADTVSHSMIVMSNNMADDTVLLSLSDINATSGWSATFSDTLLFLDPYGGRDTVAVTVMPPPYSKSDTIEYAADTCYLNAYSYASDTTFVAQIITHAYHIGVEESNEQFSMSNYQLSVHQNPFIHCAEVGAQGTVSFEHSDVVETPYMVSLQIYDLSGRLIQQLPFSSSQTVSVGKELGPGVYFLRISDPAISGSERSSPVKVVKLK
jgi:hypothetical protein